MNSETTKIKYFAPKETSIIFENDTIAIGIEPIEIFKKWSKDSLELIVLNNTNEQNFSFKSKNSFLYYANIFQNHGIGMLIDAKNYKRYAYKKVINFDVD